MAELAALYRLHKIDAALVEIKARHSKMALDPELVSKHNMLAKEYEAKKATADRLAQELKDLELQQKAIEEKLIHTEKTLYGGTIINPREVEAYEKDIGMLKRQRGEVEGKILELWETAPPAKSEADRVGQELKALRELAQGSQTDMGQERTRLEQQFKELSARRPSVVADVPAPLLKQYEAIRAKHGGIGMAEVVSRACGRCGTVLPERVLIALNEDKLLICESCHRILFKAVPEA
ncbi:MAG TPA: hypothetical protein PLH94_00335 [Fimbriimonadaceae bacterium]|nr:hypothetical protein [Fimbriimonadaceae bacterium]